MMISMNFDHFSLGDINLSSFHFEFFPAQESSRENIGSRQEIKVYIFLFSRFLYNNKNSNNTVIIVL